MILQCLLQCMSTRHGHSGLGVILTCEPRFFKLGRKVGKICRCVKMQSLKFRLSRDQVFFFFFFFFRFELNFCNEGLQAEMVRILTRCTFLLFPHIKSALARRSLSGPVEIEVSARAEDRLLPYIVYSGLQRPSDFQICRRFFFQTEN